MFDQTEEPEVESMISALAFSPHLYTDMDRLAPHVSPEVWQYLKDGGRCDGRLSAFVTAKLDTAPLSLDAARAAAEGPARIWLLPGDVLRTLARRAGITLHAAAIGTIIDRGTVQKIKQAFNAEEYEFAINRAPLLTRRVADQPIDFAMADDLSLAVDDAGWRFLKRTVHDIPAPVMERIKLKLPPTAPWNDMEPADGEATPDQVAVLARKLLREIAPQWAALFA